MAFLNMRQSLQVHDFTGGGSPEVYFEAEEGKNAKNILKQVEDLELRATS
jgi:hypothetical protein